MIRQGNQNKKVHVYTYVTEGTFDAYLYQLVEQKQKFISQIMTSKTPMRTMEDIDEKALSYTDVFGNITRINNCLESIEKDIPRERDELDNLKHQLENAKIEVQKEFPQEQELQEKEKRLEELNIELKLNEKDKELLGDEEEEKNDKTPNKNSPER